MKKNKLGLPAQIVISLILGIVVGLACYFIEGGPAFTTNYLKPFGTIFVNLLKFIVVPVVLFSMIDGIISMDDMKKVGSVGWKTVAYFMITTAIACVIGLVFANIFRAANLFPTLQLQEGAVWDKATSANFMDTLVNIFPSNMWEAFRTSNMLQVIVIALFFGGAILSAGKKGALCRDIVVSFNEVINRLMAFIISLSPIGVFTMMAWVVATQGAEILGSLALVILCAYLGYIVHAVVVYSASVAVFAKVSPLAFFKGAAAAMIFAFTSTSSTASLPVSKECAEDRAASGRHHQHGRHRYLSVRCHHIPCRLRRYGAYPGPNDHRGRYRDAGLHRHSGRFRRRYDYAGYGADRHGHPRRYDHDYLRRRPSL